MDEASITRYITGTFAGVDVVVASGASFFFYDPARMPARALRLKAMTSPRWID